MVPKFPVHGQWALLLLDLLWDRTSQWGANPPDGVQDVRRVTKRPGMYYTSRNIPKDLLQPGASSHQFQYLLWIMLFWTPHEPMTSTHCCTRDPAIYTQGLRGISDPDQQRWLQWIIFFLYFKTFKREDFECLVLGIELMTSHFAE